MKEGLIVSSYECAKCNDQHDVTWSAIKRFLRNRASHAECGAGEGFQRLKPDGSIKNLKVVKTDALLPAYCEPPNPCPLGYVADDGCLEEFENTAAFSREYQQHQNCMCDSEHMFDCPGATRESEIDALARSFENEGLAESTLDRFFHDMEIRDGHKIVAKKFFAHKPGNPYLEGEKLPVIAKKAPKSSIK
ncbi:neuroendocrine protein 7B2 [Trichonephila clavipes]|nr:neuroendocrine protein 7B2 [Trichonephila clavipes]